MGIYRSPEPDPLEGIDLWSEEEKHPLPCGCARGDGKHLWSCELITSEQILHDLRNMMRFDRFGDPTD